MNVTVAICTWNRAGLLEQTLERMVSLRIPEGMEWELLVVNNNCTDRTDEVIAQYADRLPLRRLLETRQGHSHARNCAIDAARGELLIWTDDDVLVDENWLAEYVKAAEAWPEAILFGGPIDPWFESRPPAWMERHWEVIRRVFVIRDFGPEVRLLGEREVPAGANMAFRAEVLRKWRFDDRLGRVGACLTGADDTEMVSRLRTAGHTGVWIGTARVQHFLPAERLTRTFLRNWFRGAGRTEVRQNGIASAPSVFGMPRWAVLKYAGMRAKAWCCAPLGNAAWFEAFREAAILEGFLSEARERRGERGAVAELVEA